jgi:hypothetical protein
MEESVLALSSVILVGFVFMGQVDMDAMETPRRQTCQSLNLNPGRPALHRVWPGGWLGRNY